MSHSDATLRKRRQDLVDQLAASAPFILRGSLIQRYKRCGRANCHCQNGKGHGPKHYLSVSHPGHRPQMDYVPQPYAQPVCRYLQNLQGVRQLLEEICNINRELLRRRAEF